MLLRLISTMRNTTLLPLMVLALASAAHGATPPPSDPGEMRIGTRAIKPEEIGRPELDEMVKRLGKNLPAPTPPAQPGAAPVPPKSDSAWEGSPDATDLVELGKTRPEVFMRLIIPPQQPNTVVAATGPIRARAAWILGRAGDRRTMIALLNSSCYDPEESVRIAASKALPLLNEPVTMRKLVDVACSRDYQHIPWPIRKNACAALRYYGDKESVDRILTEVTFELAGGNPLDTHNRLRGVPKGGLGTDNPIGMPDATPDLHLSDQDLYPATNAMKEVTGQSFPKAEKEVKTWTEWWEKGREKFAFKTE